MIQELLGGVGFDINGQRSRFSTNGAILEGFCPPPPPSSSCSAVTSSSSSTSTTTTTATVTENQNLKCPRCDSSNTKFCYYNNYNLTQPRHFCKTCRRYWTKGGALRNVPIGGGCRKNKSVTGGSNASVSKCSVSKMKTGVFDISRSVLGNGFDNQIQSSPVLWASPQNSQLLALLKANSSVKEETSLIGTPLMDHPLISNSVNLCNPVWKNSQNQSPYQQNGILMGHEVQSSGIQELYQRLKSSNFNSFINHHQQQQSSSMVAGNVSSSSSITTSTVLESAPADQLSYCWNPSLSWSDLPASTTNGAYP